MLILAVFGFVKGFGALGFSVGGLNSIHQDLQAARVDLQKAQLEVQQKTNQVNQLQEQIKQLQGQGGGSTSAPPPSSGVPSKGLPPPSATATLGDLAKRLTDVSDGWRQIAAKNLAKADFASLLKATKLRYDDKDPSFGAARDYDLKDTKRQAVVALLSSCVPLGSDQAPARPDLLLTYTVDGKAQPVTVVGNFAYFNGKSYFGIDLLQQVRTQIAGW